MMRLLVLAVALLAFAHGASLERYTRIERAVASARFAADGTVAALQVAPVEAASSTGASAVSEDFLKWALTQGGLVLVVLVVFWSYRRDFIRRVVREEEKVAILTEIAAESRAAVVQAVAQNTATEKAVHRLSKAIETSNQLAIAGGRRRSDHEG